MCIIIMLLAYIILYAAGVEFLSQPYNITANLGGVAFFPCSRVSEEGQHTTLPHWDITFSNGSTLQNDFPSNHTLRPDGLEVTVEDIRLNLTAYTCFYEILMPNNRHHLSYSAYPVLSTSGYLTITFPNTTFSLYESRSHRKIGETFQFVLRKYGGGNFTFNVTLHTTGKTSRILIIKSPIIVIIL